MPVARWAPLFLGLARCPMCFSASTAWPWRLDAELVDLSWTSSRLAGPTVEVSQERAPELGGKSRFRSDGGWS